MTTEPKYTDAQIETVAARLEVLSRAVADGLKSEFTPPMVTARQSMFAPHVKAQENPMNKTDWTDFS